MATYTSFATPPAFWRFLPPNIEGSYLGGDTTSQTWVNADGTRTVMNGTGMSVNGGGIFGVTFATLTSIVRLSSDGNTVLESITDITGVTSPTSVTLDLARGGDDTIIGSAGVDLMDGGEGADTFLMGAGADVAQGHIGDDLFRIQAGDWVTGTNVTGDSVGGHTGTDTVRLESVGSIAFGNGQLSNIERLEFFSGATTTVTFDNGGNGIPISTFIASAGAEHVIFQNIGTLDFSGLTFTDWMVGQDTITINNAIGGGGTLILTNQNDILNVATGANNGGISAGAGDDLMVVTGSNGSFSVDGGIGTDTLRLDGATINLGDLFTPWGNELERVQYNTGTSSITMRSDAVGAVFPTLVGGASVDTFSVRLVGSVVDLSALTFQSWAVNDRVNVTDAVNSPASTIAFQLTGTMVADTIQTAGGADIIDAGSGNDIIETGGGHDTINGGLGADRMTGGAGDDQYVVDSAGDRVTEAVAGGSDTVTTSINYRILAASEIEVFNAAVGTTALTLEGNGYGQTLNGNDGDNRLKGLVGADTLNGGIGNDLLYGGNGVDTLTGGAGLDSFVFDFAPNRISNVDTITDYNVADDRFLLDDAAFAGIGAIGALGATRFQLGTAANDADDRIIYDSVTGKVYYDANGNGAGGQIHFATVTAGTALTAAEFVIF